MKNRIWLPLTCAICIISMGINSHDDLFSSQRVSDDANYIMDQVTQVSAMPTKCRKIGERHVQSAINDTQFNANSTKFAGPNSIQISEWEAYKCPAAAIPAMQYGINTAIRNAAATNIDALLLDLGILN